jgi:hypothetical protein
VFEIELRVVQSLHYGVVDAGAINSYPTDHVWVLRKECSV